jgi:hypothetical protein
LIILVFVSAYLTTHTDDRGTPTADPNIPQSVAPDRKIYSRSDDEPPAVVAPAPAKQSDYLDTSQLGPLGNPQASPAATNAPKQQTDGQCQDFTNVKDKATLDRILVDKVKAITEQTNQDLIRNPSLAKGALSDSEFLAFSNAFGIRKSPTGVEIFSDAAFNIAYGHVLERLVADRIASDPCLNQYLEYVKNSDQTQGLPDFVGKKGAQGLELDITTPGQAFKKANEGKLYTFIEYERGLHLNAEGIAVPNN